MPFPFLNNRVFRNVKIDYSFSAMLIAGLFLFIISGCGKEQPPLPVPETGTMTDHDGNVYKTVKIGNQWWMAENLKVTTYQNGDSVNFEPSANNWKDSTPAYCIYGSSYYGFLYNYYALSDPRKLVPAGWHLPSDAEWKALEIALGMSVSSADSILWRGSKEGDKLKKARVDAGATTWYIDTENQFSVWANNESGFSALPGSCRIFNGTYGSPGVPYTGYWWSSTLRGNEVWYRYLDYNNSKIFRFYVDKRYGFSVRCVKN